jgi:hypothetical protein
MNNCQPKSDSFNHAYKTARVLLTRFTFLLVLFLLVIFGYGKSHGQVKELFTYPAFERPARLHKFVYKIGNDTTWLFKSLDSLKTESQSRGDELLLWYTRVYEANLQLLFRYKTNAERVVFLKTKQSYFEKAPFKVIRGAYYFHLSNAYYLNGEFKESFRLAFQALRIFQEVGYSNIAEASFYLNRFFEVYYSFEDYKTALTYSKLAIRFNRFELVGPAFLLNNNGMVYLRMKEYGKARQMFLKTIALAQKLNRPIYIGIANGNYGNVLRLEGKYTQALPHLYKDIELNQKILPGNSAYTCLYISDALIHLDSMNKAWLYMQQAVQLYKTEEDKRPMSHFHVLLYDIEAKYYQKSGQPYKALLYKDLQAKLRDSLLKIFDTSLLLRAESQMAAEKYLNNLEKVEEEKNLAIWKRNLFILTIFLISVAVIYGLNQRRKREKALQDAEQKRAQDQIIHATAQLEQYIENIRSKNTLIEQMNEELLLHKKISQEEAQSQLETLHQRVILTDEDWQQFKALFEQVYPDFLKNLQDKYQELSPAETRLLVLLKLNIRSKEMAYMLGVSVESLRKARYRLRRKLENLQLDNNLDELIAQL